jgi:hypothetical protein
MVSLAVASQRKAWRDSSAESLQQAVGIFDLYREDDGSRRKSEMVDSHEVGNGTDRRGRENAAGGVSETAVMGFVESQHPEEDRNGPAVVQRDAQETNGCQRPNGHLQVEPSPDQPPSPTVATRLPVDKSLNTLPMQFPHQPAATPTSTDLDRVSGEGAHTRSIKISNVSTQHPGEEADAFHVRSTCT